MGHLRRLRSWPVVVPGLAVVAVLLGALTLSLPSGPIEDDASLGVSAPTTLRGGDGAYDGQDRSDDAEAARALPARLARSVVVAEAPVSTRLPRGLRVPVRAVGTRDDGLLDVPDDIRLAGWWKGGSRIGDPFGSTLVAAHIDSTSQGLGPYAELLEVRPGQRVTVRSANLEQLFVVRSLRLLPQGPLTERQWLFSPDGPRRLTLVTCAPPYDPTRGGYQNLAVVTALPLSDPGRRGSDG